VLFFEAPEVVDAAAATAAAPFGVVEEFARVVYADN